MSWSNWLYLGLGLGLGVGGALFGRSKQPIWKSEGTVGNAHPASGDNPAVKKNNIDSDQDVTQLLQQLETCHLAYQLAHEMSQFKAGFLARTSHELRSPLNSLIGLHQLILSDLCDDPAEEREFVVQAHDAALKLVKLMDEILDVSRIQHGTNYLEIQPLQLARVLEEVYNFTHLLAANRNFTFQLTPPDPEIYVLADPRWLRQVLVSLLDTCIAQMEEGSICVSAQAIPAAELVHIWLDVQLPTSAWNEPMDLIQPSHVPHEAVYKNTAPSSGMRLLMNQTVLELMKGRLEFLPIPTDENESNFTRIQIAIPLLIPETASVGQEEDRG